MDPFSSGLAGRKRRHAPLRSTSTVAVQTRFMVQDRARETPKRAVSAAAAGTKRASKTGGADFIGRSAGSQRQHRRSVHRKQECTRGAASPIGGPSGRSASDRKTTSRSESRPGTAQRRRNTGRTRPWGEGPDRLAVARSSEAEGLEGSADNCRRGGRRRREPSLGLWSTRLRGTTTSAAANSEETGPGLARFGQTTSQGPALRKSSRAGGTTPLHRRPDHRASAVPSFPTPMIAVRHGLGPSVCVRQAEPPSVPSRAWAHRAA